ncbi:MAG: ferrous iron transport protein A [Sedimentisphaerales bacterium]|nr:ferrous iron transport protein A [Sedimentisphaerales bacterium]
MTGQKNAALPTGKAAQTIPEERSPAGETPAKPLSKVDAGKTVRFVRVDAGRGLNSRLAAMGFVPNTAITVVSNGHPGPFVIIVKDARMILGRGVAHKIMVK